MQKARKGIRVLGTVILAVTVLVGCTKQVDENNENILSDNIIVTENGEVIQKEPQPTKESVDIEKITREVQEQANAEMSDTSEAITPETQSMDAEQVITEENQAASMGNNLQLVFLGDSIFDSNRDGTGVPYLTAKQCNADIYNLAIGGTSAALEKDEAQENEKWSSKCLVGVVRAMIGDVSTECFTGTVAKDLLDDPNINWSETDYFVLEYGLNDFFKAVPQSDVKRELDITTYAGALRYAIITLRNLAPDATIILCSPHYTRFFDGNWMIGDSNTINNGNGTLADYKGTCEYIAGEQQAEFFNAYLNLEINGYTADEYLEDGIHLTEAGRRLYADALANKILKYEENKNN